eukprot:SAG22_NODE_6479_length_849_cov_0.740000_1_plen_273_part_10
MLSHSPLKLRSGCIEPTTNEALSSNGGVGPVGLLGAWSASYPVGHALDGSDDSYWCSPANTADAVYTVDLNEDVAICSIQILWHYFASSFVVAVSSDDVSYEDVYAGSASARGELSTSDDFADEITARYVRITAHSGDLYSGEPILGIREVRVLQSAAPEVENQWHSGVLAGNGKIYGIPANAEQVLIIDPSTDTADTSSITGVSVGNKWVGGVLAGNGKIYGMPTNAEQVLIITPAAVAGECECDSPWFAFSNGTQCAPTPPNATCDTSAGL